MVLFSTKFALSDDLTRQEFLTMLSEWLKDSSSYSIEPVFNDTDNDYEFVSDDATESLLVYMTASHLAIQLTKRTDDFEFISTYIMTTVDEIPVMFIRLEKSLAKASAQQDFKLQIPKLMREIFWREYGGLDHGILTDDKAFILRKKDVDLATDILTSKIEFFNPIVYVSVVESNGRCNVNYDKLASELLGIGHVVVEGSPYVSQLIHDKVSDKHPANGDIVVLLPSGESELFLKDDDVSNQITEYVRKSMSNVIVDDAFSFSKIRLSYVLSKCNTDGDLSNICDELLQEKDNEISVLKSEISSLQKKSSDLACKVDTYEQAFKKSKDCDDEAKVLQFTVSETDLYDGELQDVVLRILKKEYDGMKGDKNLVASRKYGVLGDILANNDITDKADELRDAFKHCVKDGTMSREAIREAERYGFSVAKSGSNHYKILFNGDSRYQMAMSSTPSDNRAGDNLVATYMNMLFGY